MINPNIFRAYDIRGVAKEELTNDVCYSLGRGYATYLRREGLTNCSIGRDIRLSSERIRDSIIEGMLDGGLNVTDIGMVPTPLLYFSCFFLNKQGGVMITGSHNPSAYNGFKLLKRRENIYGEEIQKLRQIIGKKEFVKGKGVLENTAIVDEYIKMVEEKITIENPKKIVLDPGNGTCGPIVKRIFKDFQCENRCIYCEPDGNFPNHLPDPTIPAHMESLKKEVLDNKADIGIGYDGDGDRIGVIDEKGNIIWGDKLLGIYSKEILRKNPGAPIIFEVKCSEGLVEYIKSLGGKPVMWKTGHSLIKAKMREINSPLAGEMSGHMFFNDYYFGYDDAIFASLRLVQILSREGKPLSSLASEIPYYYSTPEIRIDSTDEGKFDVVEAIKKEFSSNYSVIDIDGVRVNFGDGWGLVRASNTQPVLVLRFEAKTKKRLEEIQEMMMKRVEKINT